MTYFEKFMKIIRKSVFGFPRLALIIMPLVMCFTTKFELWIILLGGYALSILTTLIEALKYDSFPKMIIADYLESKHKVILPKSEIVVKVISREAGSVFSDVILTDEEDEHGYRLYDISMSNGIFYSYSSYLKIDFLEKVTVLSIKPKWFGYLPDYTKNYKLLHSLKTKIEDELKNSNNSQ